eukprot:4200193-Pleurochrysis_carterae.AAC.2
MHSAGLAASSVSRSSKARCMLSLGMALASASATVRDAILRAARGPRGDGRSLNEGVRQMKSGMI